MSTTIDSKVVEMKFDNKQFESGVNTSISTIGKLKSNLDFTGAEKGLEGVSTSASKLKSNLDFSGAEKGLNNVAGAAGNCNIGALGDAVQTVKAKFGALEVAAITVFASITNAALEAGKKMVSSIMDPIKSGFSEYETQISAVQTILANTSSKGTTLEQVNGALNELNTYADKTIYNFTEMTKNIGTFTAAGIDLKTSTQAIKGIANMAALSGSNAQQASTAMYQLSQALSTGSVKLMDWNSVTNAGMGGEVFKNSLIETAKVHGVEVDKMIEANGSFRDSLQEGWLTSAVLTETLAKFTGDLSDEQLKTIGYSDEQIKGIQQMATTANDAATKVKTVSQLIDTLKEANQSGWTKSWELLIGDFGEAKKLLTEVSDVMGGIIGASSNARNAILSGGLSSGYKQFLDAGVMDAGAYQDAITEVAKQNGISMSEFQKNGETFEEGFNVAFRRGVVTSDMMTEALSKMTSKTAEMSAEQLKDAGYTDEQVKKLEELNQGLANGTINIDDFTKKIMRSSGRDNLIEALRNSFYGLLDILKPVKEAFLEVFPMITGEQLYALTEKIRLFTEKFIVLPDLADKIKRTFKGLFSAFDIIGQVIVAVVKGVKSLIDGFQGIFGTVKLSTEVWGDWWVALDESLKKTDLFNKGIQTFVGWILTAASVVKDFSEKAIAKIKEFFSMLQEKFNFPAFETFDQFMIRVRTRMAEVGADATDMKNTFTTAITMMGESIQNSTFWKFLSSVGDKIKEMGSKIGDLLGGVKDKITEALSGASFNSTSDALNAGLFVGLAIGIKSFISGLSNPLDMFKSMFDSVKSVVDGFKGILDSVRGCFEAYQTQIKAGALLKIAIAIAVLTASILLLSLVDSSKLTVAVTAITVLFADLVASMAGLDKIGGGMKGVGKMTLAMIAIAASVLILANALAIVAAIEPGKIGNAVLAITVMISEIIASIMVLSKNKDKMSQGLVQLIALAISIKILAGVIADLSALKPEALAQGVLGVTAILAALTLFLKLSQTKKDASSNALEVSVAVVILAAAMKIFASACSDFGNMKPEAFKQGLIGIGSLIAMSAIFALVSKKAGNPLAAGLMIVAIAGGMAIMAKAIGELGSLPLNTMIQGLIGMAVVLGGVLLFVRLLPKGAEMVSTGAGMLIIAGAVYVLALAVEKMGSMSLENLVKGLCAMGIALAILVISLSAMQGTLAGSAALLVASVALLLLGSALTVISKIPIDKLAIAVLAIAAVFVILGVAGLAAAAVAPGLIILALALGALGLAVLGVGLGVSLLAAGIAALAVSGQAGATALTTIVTSMLGLIPLVMQKIAEGILSFCDVFSTGGPTIIAAATTLIMSLLTAIEAIIPKAVETVIAFVSALLKALADSVPSMVDSGMKLIKGLLDGVAANIQGVVESGISVIVNFIKGVTDKLPSIIDAAFKLIIAFINGMATAIDENHDAIITAVEHLIQSILDAFGDVVTRFAPIGKNIIDGIINGIKNMAGSVKDAVVSVGNTMLTGLKDALGIASPSKEFGEIGMFSVLGLVGSLLKYAGLAVDAAKKVGTSALNAMSSALSTVSDVISGDVDMTPVIRPVLDLSNVKSGASTLNGMLSNGQSISVSATNKSLAIADQIAAQMAANSATIQNGVDSAPTPTNSKSGLNQTVNIYSPTALSPAETARQNKRVLQEFALQF